MKPINKQRRTILNSLSIAGAGSLLLPSEWSKPIFNSIVLPAHAQTSDMLSIAGFSVTSESRFLDESQFYQIDDVSNGVNQPQLITVSEQFNSNTLRIRIVQSFQNGLDSGSIAQVSITIGENNFFHSIDVGGPDNGDGIVEINIVNVPASVESDFLSNSGNTWRASYSVSVLDETTMVFEDIILTRV